MTIARIALSFALAIAPAFAFGQDAARMWGGGASVIRLQPTDAPGAVAEVEFSNDTVHPDEISDFSLSLGGFSVRVHAVLGRGMAPDEVTVTPPDGFLAVPSTIRVPEGETMVITIYSMEGVGV